MQIVSLTLSSMAYLDPVAGQMSRRLEIGQDAVDDRQCSVCLIVPCARSTTRRWESPSCPLNQLVVSSAQSAESSLLLR